MSREELKPPVTIVKCSNWADTRISIELSDGRKFDLHINRSGFPEVLSDEPQSIGDFIPNRGYTLPVGHFGHPYED